MLPINSLGFHSVTVNVISFLKTLSSLYPHHGHAFLVVLKTSHLRSLSTNALNPVRFASICTTLSFCPSHIWLFSLPLCVIDWTLPNQSINQSIGQKCELEFKQLQHRTHSTSILEFIDMRIHPSNDGLWWLVANQVAAGLLDVNKPVDNKGV